MRDFSGALHAGNQAQIWFSATDEAIRLALCHQRVMRIEFGANPEAVSASIGVHVGSVLIDLFSSRDQIRALNIE